MGEEAMNTSTVALKQDYWEDPASDLGCFSDARTRPLRIPEPEISERTTASIPTWFQPTFDRFLELLELQENWDQRGSAQVRSEVLSFALRSVLPRILPPTAPAPAVIPLGHGGIQLVWNSNTAEIEVEVIAPYSVIAYQFDKTTGQETEEQLTMDFSDLAKLMWSTFNTVSTSR
jgi:hypothetical protein